MKEKDSNFLSDVTRELYRDKIIKATLSAGSPYRFLGKLETTDRLYVFIQFAMANIEKCSHENCIDPNWQHNFRMVEPELFERTLLSCQGDLMTLAMATALLLHRKIKSYVYEGHNFDQFYVRQYVVVSRVKYVAKVFCKPVDSVAKLNPFDVDDLMTNLHSVVVLKSTTGATGEEFILDMSPQQYGIRELFFRPITAERYVRIMKAKIHKDIKDPLQHLSDMGKSEYPLPLDLDL